MHKIIVPVGRLVFRELPRKPEPAIVARASQQPRYRGKYRWSNDIDETVRREIEGEE